MMWLSHYGSFRPTNCQSVAHEHRFRGGLVAGTCARFVTNRRPEELSLGVGYPTVTPSPSIAVVDFDSHPAGDYRWPLRRLFEIRTHFECAFSRLGSRH